MSHSYIIDQFIMDVSSSSSIERTQVLRNPKDMINTTVEDFSRLKERIDICCDHKGVSVTLDAKPIWEGYEGEF